jgi:multiple sugar transport system substrate-binding protein
MKKLIGIILALVLVVSMVACDSNKDDDKTPAVNNNAGGESKDDAAGDTADNKAGESKEKVTITIWRGQGTDFEEKFYNEQIEKFNAQSTTTEVKYEVFPYNDFGTTVRSAISTDSLPDLVYVDGTEVGNLVFLEALAPLDEYLDEDFISQYASSAFYKVGDKTYGVAQQDGGLAFWANKAYLDKAGVRIATYEDPWDKEEFLDALEKLQALDEVEYAIDMKTNWGTGYVVYAWQPLIKALGADWYNNDTLKAGGALDSQAMVDAMTFMKGLVDKGYVNAMETIDTAFKDGTSALDLTGHWNYNDYSAALGDNLVLIPLPDLGNGSYTGIGGLPFAATSTAMKNGTVANCAEFIKFALGEQFQNQINDVNGSLPVMTKVLNSQPKLQEGGPLYLYAQQLMGGKYAVRPVSPAFPTYQSEVGTAAFDIFAGADIKETLTKAATAIDKVIEENGY